MIFNKLEFSPQGCLSASFPRLQGRGLPCEGLSEVQPATLYHSSDVFHSCHESELGRLNCWAAGAISLPCAVLKPHY